MIQGIQIIKFFNWESQFIDNIAKLREKEMATVKVFLFVQTCSNVLWGMLLNFYSFVLNFPSAFVK